MLRILIRNAIPFPAEPLPQISSQISSPPAGRPASSGENVIDLGVFRGGAGDRDGTYAANGTQVGGGVLRGGGTDVGNVIDLGVFRGGNASQKQLQDDGVIDLGVFKGTMGRAV